MLSSQIDVWRAHLDVEVNLIYELEGFLDPEEKSRAAAFRFSIDQRRYIAAHGILRQILARYLDSDPGAIRFARNEYGKPELVEPPRQRLHFNLSHTNDLALVAVSETRSVGVDVEHYRDDDRLLEVAEDFFAPGEIAMLRSLPSTVQSRAFLHCWVSKEAYVKARGQGLSIPLTSFEVSVDPDIPAMLLSGTDGADTNKWRLEKLSLGEGYLAALAAPGDGWGLRTFDWAK